MKFGEFIWNNRAKTSTWGEKAPIRAKSGHSAEGGLKKVQDLAKWMEFRYPKVKNVPLNVKKSSTKATSK